MKFPYLLTIVIALQACSAPSAPDFPKRGWKPLNDLPEHATAIALHKQYVYQVVQLDTTVKGLLQRWADESNMALVYDHTHDFTLFKQVKNIRQPDLQNALLELSGLYSDKGMVFYIDNGVIMAHQKTAAALNLRSESKAAKTQTRR